MPTISSNSVLFGIAAPRVVLRSPGTLLEDETLTLAAPNLAPKLRFTPEARGDSPLLRKARNGRLRDNPQGFRGHILLEYQELSVAQAQDIGKIYNGWLARYRIFMTIHNDDALKITYEVLPEGDFALGYIADKYIGHNGTFSFQTVELISNIQLQTSLNLARQRTYPL